MIRNPPASPLAGGAVKIHFSSSSNSTLPFPFIKLQLKAPGANTCMPVFTDQTGRTIQLTHTPVRIVSLVPSQTELLFDLGLEREIAGITKFCVHPEIIFRSKPRVGGTKQLNIEAIRQLDPDLILANKEENTKEQIELLGKEFPVWVSDVNDIPGAYDMITRVGEICDRKERAQELASEIREGISGLPVSLSRPRSCYLIWRKPYMTAGGDTFIHSMMGLAGFENIFAAQQRYPEITIESLRDKDCELLLLSSEPFPFKQSHADELKEQLPTTMIRLVDGEMFSWYGSRMRLAGDYFRKLIGNLR